MSKRRFAPVNFIAVALVLLSSNVSAFALVGPRTYVNEVTGDVFLGGEYIELGISRLGSFGTTYDEEDEEATVIPEGFFGTLARSAIGMSTNPSGFGVAPDLRMDFFMPGSPEERWVVGFMQDAIPVTGTNSLLNDGVDIPDNIVTDESSGDILRARSIGTFADKLQVTQVMSFDKSDKFFKNTVTLKNVDSAPLDSVRYMRNFDPDNTVDQEGDYTTRNQIAKTHAAGDGMSLVVADTDLSEIEDPEFDGYEDPVHAINGSYSPIFFYSSDSRARVSTYGFDNIDPYAPEAYDEAPEKGTIIYDDIAINITFDVGTLTPGASETFTYYTSLDNRDINEIVDDIATDEENLDNDADNVPNSIEDAGPNNGDANGDGVQDSSQANVSSVPNTVAGDNSYIALELDGDCGTITDFSLKSEVEVKDDGEYNYPLGLADFAASCSSVGGSTSIKVYFDKQHDTSNWTIRKYMNGAYQTVLGYTLGTATVGSSAVTLLTYTVVDGGQLDADGVANGVIVDPAGPAVLAAGSPNTGVNGKNSLIIVAPPILTAIFLGYAIFDRRSVKNAKISQASK